MAQDKDLYAVLGVTRSASEDDLKKAFRRLAKQLHPDVNPGNKSAEARFKDINVAYEVLKDPQKRKLYDEFGDVSLQQGFDAQKARAWKRRPQNTAGMDDSVPFGGGGTPFGGFGSGVGGFDVGDLFGEMFQRGSRGGPIRGAAQDVTMLADLDLGTALKGTQLEVRVPTLEACKSCSGSGQKANAKANLCKNCKGTGRRTINASGMRMAATCDTCNGTGTVTDACTACSGRGATELLDTVTVRIPPGADDGSRLRVTGRGINGGDLVIETRIKPHPFFRRDGLDLHLKLPVTLDETWNGATVDVPTPDGNVNLRVPPQSQPGNKLRLKGKGVRRGDAVGDLYVELDVRLPDRDDAAFSAAVKAAERAYTRPVRQGIKL